MLPTPQIVGGGGRIAELGNPQVPGAVDPTKAKNLREERKKGRPTGQEKKRTKRERKSESSKTPSSSTFKALSFSRPCHCKGSTSQRSQIQHLTPCCPLPPLNCLGRKPRKEKLEGGIIFSLIFLDKEIHECLSNK